VKEIIMKETKYGFGKELNMTYEEALEKLPGALEAEGFGILTEIDAKAVLKKKLDVDFRKYKIFGACNSSFAYQALQAETEIGLLLPCNIIVYESDTGKAVVMAMDPIAIMGLIEKEGVRELANEVKDKLITIINSLE
jgi:uncharacterized protein (DUF302 family)